MPRAVHRASCARRHDGPATLRETPWRVCERGREARRRATSCAETIGHNRPVSITVSNKVSQRDIDEIHRFLSEESYWAKGIPRTTVERSIENSLPFAAHDGERLVGFARVVTDYAVFAYVADVFVVDSHRGRSVSKMIMKAMMEHPSLQGLRRWCLLTSDAHGLYRQFGFEDVVNAEKYMEIAVKNPYGVGV